MSQELEQESFASIEEADTPQAQPTVEPQEVTLPEKFKGKSTADLAKMYQELEQAFGRQGQEVGELRRLADEVIRAKIQPAPVQQAEPEDEDIDEVEFFANPKQAIQKAIDRHPKVQQAVALTQQLGQRSNQQRMLEKHPDALEITNSEEFKQFVSASPLRQKLFVAAHKMYNLEAADELLSTFKELKSVRQTQATERTADIQQDRDRNLRNASVAVGGTGEVGKKIYRRADLIELKIRNPDRYAALENEIMSAYAEGRVR